MVVKVIRFGMGLFIGFLNLQFAYGQKDTLNPNGFPTLFRTQYSIDRNLNPSFEDTLINRDEVYYPYSRKIGAYQDLGNIGTPGRLLFFNWDRPTDFNLGFNPYQVFFKTPESTKYYTTKRPYANFTYTQGQRDLLLFGATYTMNLSPRFNFGVDMNRVTSTGFYSSQYTSAYFTNLYISYFSKNNRYGLLANSIWNRGVLDESGGILSDSLFETLQGTNKAAPVRLYESQSRFKSKTYYAKQYFYLGSLQTLVQNDDTSYYVSRNGFISHTLQYQTDNYFFDNPEGEKDSLLFPGANYDTTGIFYDSIGSRTVMNRFAYAYWTKSSPIQQSFIEFAIGNKSIFAQQQGLENRYLNVWGEAKLERIPKTERNLGLKLLGVFCFTGYNQNDFKLSGEFSWLNRQLNLTGGFTNQLLEPDYNLVYYKSNPFTWNNKYSKINVANWYGSLTTKKFRHNFNIRFNQYLIANWVYNGLTVSPEQSNKILLINTLSLQKTIQVGWFYFDHQFCFQNANLGIVRLPAFSSNLRYFLKANLFRNKLKIETGASLNYNTAYYANSYHPSARMFYLQDETKVGNYPLIDAFITAQVMTAIIYLKMEHVNMDWMNSGFYYTPHYPLPVRAFRLGFRIRLYN